MDKQMRFVIVGLGVMGGSYALALKNAGHHVAAIDHNPATLSWALEHGVVQQAAQAQNAQPLLAQADCVVLCIYPKDILPWLQTNAPFIKSDAIITDIAGVKTCFLPQAQQLLGSRNEFIACHPMAGSEKSGVQWANSAMFKDANFLIVPTAKNTAKGLAFAHSLAQVLQAGRVTQLDMQQHDAMIGYVSQLTHAIAVSLMVANNDELLPKVTGDSFRDLTRIADINDELWSELFFANAPALCAEIDLFTRVLQQLKTAVENKDEATLRSMMQRSAQRRRSFTKQDSAPKGE